MKRLLKEVFTLLFVLISLPLLYFFLAYLFTFFPKMTDNKALEMKTEKVYLLYNEMHSDIVFKIEDLNLSHFPEFQHKKNGYIAFGWGDKETYLNTPTWSEIKVSTSLKALFINTPSLIHLTYYKDILRYQEIKEIPLNKRQKEQLIHNILKSFKQHGRTYRGYSKEDFFYTAKGSYNLFQTCNCWTGKQLRHVGVTMSYWTPLSQNVIDSLP